MNNDLSNIIYTEITGKLRAVNRNENISILLQGILKSISLLIINFTVFSLLEGLFNFNTPGRTILFFIFSAFLLGIIINFTVIPLLKYFNIINNYHEETLAKRIGDHFPSLKDNLLNSLQLYRSLNNKYKYSSGFVEASLAQAGNNAKNLNFDAIIDKSQIKKYFQLSLVLILLFTISMVTSSDFYLSSFNRIIHFNQSFLPPAPFYFTIKPGNIEATKGDSINIIIHITGQKQEEVDLKIRYEELKDFESNKILPDALGDFYFKIKSIRSSLEYFAESKGISSETYNIKIIDRPVIKNLRVSLTYPAYSGLQPRYLDDNFGEITALNGTKAKIELNINRDIKKANIVFSDSTCLPMNINGHNASTEMKITKNRNYHFELEDEKGIKNIDPIEYPVKVLPDEFPSIVVLEPGKNVDIKEDMRLSMQMKAKDDYGFSKMTISYKLIKSKYSRPQDKYKYQSIPLPSLKGPEIDVPYIWNLTDLNLTPEDVISYYIEIFDNDIIAGPKSSRSSDFFVRFPSLDEIYSKVDDIQKQAIKEMDKSFDESKDLKKKLDEINQDLKKNKENIDWQKQKKIDETMKKYEELQKKVDQVSNNLSEMTKVMQENKLLSQETMDKYMELQKLFSEINSSEFQQAMKKMQDAMQSLNPDAIKQAMQNFTFNEQNFRESIERTSNILKRIVVEQKTDEITKRIEELISKQEDLKKEAGQTNPNDQNKLNELSKKQDDLSKELAEARKEMKNLENKMQEFPNEMPLSDLNKIMQDLQEQDNESSMESAGKEMQNGQPKKAQEKQDKVLNNLKNTKAQMQKMKKNLLEGQKQQILNALRKSLKEILEVSKQEEELRNQAQSSSQNSPRNREIAQKQMELQSDLTNVVNQLYNLSQKTPVVTPEMGKSIGTAMSNMNQAITNLVQRDNISASGNQNQAMSSLNKAAMQIQDGMDQMNQPGGSGGGLQSLLQKLGAVAGRQQGINQGMGSLPMSGGGQMTVEQQAALQRMLGEQQAVKKSLDQLKEEAATFGNKDKLMGDLDKISKDMEEVIKEMRQNNVDQNTIQKQERILSRLLDAQRSMRERDFEKKRKSESGKDFIRTSPKDIDLNSIEGKNKLQQDLLKAIEEGYTGDYEELIKKYYEILQKTQPVKKNK
jgi:hypothetical protein